MGNNRPLRTCISASMMCADTGRLLEEAQEVARSGVDLLHFDVMDGRFVPNFGFAPWMIRAVRKAINLPFEVHLMIERPEMHIRAFIEAGADIVIIHLEASYEVYRLLKEIRKLGAQAGIALSPATDPRPLKYILPYADMVTVMTVSPGFAGGEFLPEMVGKVADIAELIDKLALPVPIEVDGNINPDTIPILAKAGANIFVGGSSGLYRRDMSLSEAVQAMRAAADSIYGEAATGGA